MCLLFRGEVALVSVISVRNCLKFYKVAEEIGAKVLQTHCSQLISTHWVRPRESIDPNERSFSRVSFQNDFTSEDFQHLPAPMTYKLFKQKTKYSLHQAIRMKREDVLFLYLIDNDADVRQTVESLILGIATVSFCISSWPSASTNSTITANSRSNWPSRLDRTAWRRILFDIKQISITPMQKIERCCIWRSNEVRRDIRMSY